jgi:hypothetical protein
MSDDSQIIICQALLGFKITYVAVIILFGLAATYVTRVIFLSPLAGIPGPFWAPYSRFWLAYHAKKGDMHLIMRKVHERYGPLVRIATDEVSVADLSAIKEIYREHSRLWHCYTRH